MIYLTDYRFATSTETKVMEDIKYPQTVHWCPDTYAKLKTGLFYPPHRMADKVIDKELAQVLREDEQAKTGFILASGNSNFAGINPLASNDNILKYQYKFLPFTLTNVYAGRVAQMFGTKDHISTDATACASSLKVLMDVQTLINYYGFDRVIVLAVEDQITNMTLDFFGETQASLLWKTEKEGISASAFDNKNYGFHVGQGACLAVFENEVTIRRRNAIPKARLLGAYTSSETCSNAIGQNDTGEGFVKSSFGSLSIANLKPSNIDVIKTHGTGTQSNNHAEKSAIHTVFGVNNYVATSYKPSIGHTMGASGLLETCLLIDDMQKGSIPKIANRTEDDEVFLSETISSTGKSTILSMSAGMGNVYSSAILTMEI